jgi:hypothetical protein
MSTPSLSGQFWYQCCRNEPVDMSGGKVVSSPVLAESWTPFGTLDVKIDAVMGDVFDTYTFRPAVVLNVIGKISPTANPLLASVELKGEGLGASY